MTTPSGPTPEPVPLQDSKTRLPSLDELILLRETHGGVALLAALAELPSNPRDAFKLQERVFELLVAFGDPGATEALVAFLSKPQHPYFETRAALALAALGDLRAAPFLALRLRRDPLEVYNPELKWEQPLQRDDHERVAAARAIAELAILHPEARAALLEQTENALWFWLHAAPAPHNNGMRALALLGSQQNVDEFRAWANPQSPLPAAGASPPIGLEWFIAQLALRHIGQLHDEASFPLLLSALERRPKGVDGAEKTLPANDSSQLAQSLSALAQGAAQGFAEWRDARAWQALVAYVHDPLNHAAARTVAGAALGWVGSDKDLERLAKGVAQRDGLDDDAQEKALERACLLEGLRVRPAQGVAAALLPLLATGQPAAVRELAALAIGRNPLNKTVETRLIPLLSNKECKTQVALALMLGGSADAAMQSVRTYVASEPSIDDLAEAWSHAFTFSTDDVENGTLFRYLRNAEAIAAVALETQAQGWALSRLGRELKGLSFDSGPHSLTRAVLIGQLWSVARGNDAERARLAVRAFTLLNERGHLLELSRGSGAVAEAARAAYQSSSLVGPTR